MDPFLPIEPDTAVVGLVDTDALLEDLEEDEAVREALADPDGRAPDASDTGRLTSTGTGS